MFTVTEATYSPNAAVKTDRLTPYSLQTQTPSDLTIDTTIASLHVLLPESPLSDAI